MAAMQESRTTIFWAIAATALVSQLVTSAMTATIAAGIVSDIRSQHFVLAATVVDFLGLGLLAASITLQARSASRMVRLVCCGLASMLSLTAMLLTIVALSRAIRITTHLNYKHIAAAGIAFWTVSLITQVLLFTWLLWPHREIQEMPVFQVKVETPSPARSAKRALSVHLTSLKPSPYFLRSPPNGDSSPRSPYSPYSSSPTSSLRSSMQQMVRPVSSMTKLIRRQSSTAASIPPLPMSPKQDGFEDWDTSTAEVLNDSPLGIRTTRARLPPIPGSRPVSPAKPLNGPFITDLAPEHTPLPDSPMQSPLTDVEDFDEYPLPTLRRPSTSSTSHFHVHPLFRPDSPVPPPLPSPGTVITASPYGGQVVSMDRAPSTRTLQSMTRRGSDAPLSPSMSRPGSIKSFRMQYPPPTEPLPPIPVQHDRNLQKDG